MKGPEHIANNNDGNKPTSFSLFSNGCFQLKLILFPIGLNYRPSPAELAGFLRKELAGALTKATLNKDTILSFCWRVVGVFALIVPDIFVTES